MLGFKQRGLSFAEPILLIGNKKHIVNFTPQTTRQPLRANAKVQPHQRSLSLSPIDQRSFKEWDFYTNAKIRFDPADLILWRNTYYKILSDTDWSLDGHVCYTAIEDFYSRPNFAPITFNNKVAIGICEIISNTLAQIGKPAFDGQIFVYNSNYTVPIPQTFFVVVQLVSTQAIAVGNSIQEDANGVPYEALSNGTIEQYEINIFSADASTSGMINTIRLGFNSIYSIEKQREVGFTLNIEPEIDNISGSIGATIVDRWVIKTQCQTTNKLVLNPICTYTSIDFTTVFEVS